MDPILNALHPPLAIARAEVIRADAARERCDVYGPLRYLWTRIISFNITIGVTSIEAYVSRPLRGPACIESISYYSNSANAISADLVVGVGDNDTPPQTVLDVPNPLLEQTIGDTANSPQAVVGNPNFGEWIVNKHTDLTLFRIIVAVNNRSAAGFVIAGTVRVSIYERTCDPYPITT
jgi:hypothetical protein